jgi:hypothetical protein
MLWNPKNGSNLCTERPKDLKQVLILQKTRIICQKSFVAFKPYVMLVLDGVNNIVFNKLRFY